MYFGFISSKHFVIEYKFSEHYSMSHFTQMRNLSFKDIVDFRGSSWQTVAASLAAAVFPSVRWGFAGAWPSADWQSFDRWSGTGCSGVGHWSLPSSAADASEACQAAAALDLCLDSATGTCAVCQTWKWCRCTLRIGCGGWSWGLVGSMNMVLIAQPYPVFVQISCVTAPWSKIHPNKEKQLMSNKPLRGFIVSPRRVVISVCCQFCQ